jgi:hypothetical protein
MNKKSLPHLRLYGTALAFLAELAHLAWEHFHGGIISHHILNRADLPSISNAWGLLLLPALTWFLIGRVLIRNTMQNTPPSATQTSTQTATQTAGLPNSVIIGFKIALLFGVVLSSCFANRYKTITEYLFLSILLLALILPVYRAECVLGFVIGMSFVFGVILPTGIATIIASISMLLHLIIYPVFVRIWVRFK